LARRVSASVPSKSSRMSRICMTGYFFPASS
jgi:hypothetical protein